MSVKKLAANRYLVRVQIDGHDRRLIAPTKSLADELQAKLVQDRIRVRHGLHVDQPRSLFSDFWEEWLNRFEHGSAGSRKPRPRTLENVQELRQKLNALDNLWLDEITRERLERLAAGIAAGGKQDRAYKTLGLAKRVLRDAHERGLQVDGRVFQARIAPPRPREQMALTWEQVMEVALWMPEHAFRSVPFLALTGLRVSEFCALTDDDIVFAKTGPATENDISGERLGRALSSSSSGFDGGASYLLIRASKTDAGIRKVILCAEAVRLLREQMIARPNAGTTTRSTLRASGDKRLVDPASAGGIESGDSGRSQRLLFPNAICRPYNRRSYHKLLTRAAHHAGIPGVHPHTLRTTCASLMRQQGIAVEVIGRQLGWSPSTLARMIPIYSKLYGGEVERAVGLLDAMVADVEREAEEA